MQKKSVNISDSSEFRRCDEIDQAGVDFSRPSLLARLSEVFVCRCFARCFRCVRSSSETASWVKEHVPQ